MNETPQDAQTPEDEVHFEAPVNPVPPVLWVMVAVILGVELLFVAGEAGIIGGMSGPTWRVTYLEKFAFFDKQFDWMIENGTLRAKYLMRFVTYPFLQPSFLIAAIVSVFILALGRLMSRKIGQAGVLTVFFGATILGALAFGLAWTTDVPLFSGLTGAYGLVGGYTLLIWHHLRDTGGRQLNAFGLIGVLIAAQLLFALFYGEGRSWVSEMTGFISGFFLTWILVPGVVSGLIDKARQRS